MLIGNPQKFSAMVRNLAWPNEKISTGDCIIFATDKNVAAAAFSLEKFLFIEKVAGLCKTEIAKLSNGIEDVENEVARNQTLLGRKLNKNEMGTLLNGYSRKALPSIISTYRNLLLTHGLNKEDHAVIFFFLKADRALMAENRDSYKIKVKETVLREFASSDIDSYVARAIALLKEDSHVKKVAGLCVLTGRRPIEIMLTAKFSPCDKGENWTIFTGQAKTKDSEFANDNYAIPLLCNFSIVESGLASLRAKKDFSKIEIREGDSLQIAIHKQQAGELNKCVKKTFLKFPAISTIYDLRALYCAIQAHLIKPNNVDSFYSSLLGHSQTDIQTQQSYKKFIIVDAAVTVEKAVAVEKVTKTMAVEKVTKAVTAPVVVEVIKPVTRRVAKLLPPLPKLIKSK